MILEIKILYHKLFFDIKIIHSIESIFLKAKNENIGFFFDTKKKKQTNKQTKHKTKKNKKTKKQSKQKKKNHKQKINKNQSK